ncbi:hypothetical protein L9F63_024469, partial [Diploptera punctata]
MKRHFKYEFVFRIHDSICYGLECRNLEMGTDRCQSLCILLNSIKCNHILLHQVIVDRGMKTLIDSSVERNDGFSEYLRDKKSVKINVQARVFNLPLGYLIIPSRMFQNINSDFPEYLTYFLEQDPIQTLLPPAPQIFLTPFSAIYKRVVVQNVALNSYEKTCVPIFS